MAEKPVISIAGTGNVAFHLGSALAESYRIRFLLGRDEARGTDLAQRLGTTFTANEADLKDSDLVICCYSDDALREAIPRLSRLAPVVSTSGTADVLALDRTYDTGVFYPLQSFSGEKRISLAKLAVFTEASSPELGARLREIAFTLGCTPVEMDAAQRLKLHVAAVFTNNFTNHIIAIAQKFAADNGISYDYLLPLLDKTIEKIHLLPAKENQTGPARRNDRQTLEKHLSLLSGDTREIYRLLSESIIKEYL